MGDFGTYLGSIDVGLAIAVAAVMVLVAIVVRLFILATADEGLGALPIIGAILARSALGRRRGLAAQPWFCDTCRSLNPAAASLCYRGCGPRTEHDVGELPGGMPASPSGGTSRRRG
jgi:hypothetical protein